MHIVAMISLEYNLLSSSLASHTLHIEMPAHQECIMEGLEKAAGKVGESAGLTL